MDYIWTHKFVRDLAIATRGYTEDERYETCLLNADQEPEEALRLYGMVNAIRTGELRNV